MIVGTAGHIDHGKTTLVRALTGVDTDRLPEEKRRGISIELGYAYLDTGAESDGRIGFVDVPGHERLVATMLSGASGIDHALLLVAADDGVMPQTREHLAALALLGIPDATLVVTKADRADDARVAEVAADAMALLRGTPLDGAPVFAVAATEGRGVAALRDHLLSSAAARAARRRSSDASTVAFGVRIAVDRAFSLAGVGTVATGTAHAGAVSVGDVLVAAPAVADPMRVRGLHAQNAATARAVAGQRVAVNLAGVETGAASRGGWLVDPRVALSSDRIDVALTVWRDEPRAVRSGATVHVHIGSADTLATVAVLDGAGSGASTSALAPGASGRVQLLLRTPMAAWRGDRVVLRDASASRVVAGGRVLDPFAPARHRRSAARLAELDACAADTCEARLAAALDASTLGVDLDRWRRAEGLVALPAMPVDALQTDAAASPAAIGRAAAVAWADAAVASLAAFHRDRPDELGPDAARLRRLAAPRLADAVWRLVLAHAVDSGRIARAHGLLHLPQHAVTLGAVEQRIAQKALPLLAAGGFDPPWVRTLATDLREPEAQLRAALLRVAQRGELHQVVNDLFYPPKTMDAAAAIVRTLAARDGVVTAAAFRDASGLGRKRAIQIVEYLDRVGLLRRVGDEHRLRADCDRFAARPTA